MKAHIANIHKNVDKGNIRGDQARWEYLKRESRKFSIKNLNMLLKNTKTLLLKNQKNYY